MLLLHREVCSTEASVGAVAFTAYSTMSVHNLGCSNIAHIAPKAKRIASVVQITTLTAYLACCRRLFL
jgi:hypothetical protein